MPVLTIGLVARLWLALPGSWGSVPVVKGPILCQASPDRVVAVSGRVVLVGKPFTGKEEAKVWAVGAGQSPSGEVGTSDLIKGIRVDKDGRYGPVESVTGLILTASAPGFEPASVMVTCSSNRRLRAGRLPVALRRSALTRA